MERARKIREKYEKELLKKPNVIGVGVGLKIKGGKVTDEPAIMVYVTRKLPKEHLSKEELVPEEIEGVKTDVVEVGIIRALGFQKQVSHEDRRKKWRPAPGGVSIGHFKITAGTLACKVYDAKYGTPLGLSNNHVLADENRARIGEPILQPGPYDGGRLPLDVIGYLYRFVPIRFPGSGKECEWIVKIGNAIAKLFNLPCEIKAVYNYVNRVDAAVFKPEKDDWLSDEILEVGKIEDVSSVREGEIVKKSGRTTGLTYGTVVDTDAKVKVWYDQGIAEFENQIIVYHTHGQFSSGGDSGSLVLDQYNNAVGLLFAGSDKVTVVNNIWDVKKALNIKFK